MRGRKPKPSALVEVLGNPSRRRLNPDEPRPGGVAQKPAFLEGRASQIWDQYTPQLIANNLLTSLDGHSFAVWCSLAAELEHSPERMTASRIAQLRAIGSCFGLDPSSRSRLSAQTFGSHPGSDIAQRDPAEEYFTDSLIPEPRT